MKNHSKGLKQLQSISQAGNGRFSTADNILELEQVLTHVAKEEFDIVVRQPDIRQNDDSKHKKEPALHPELPTQKTNNYAIWALIGIIVALLVTVLLIGYRTFQKGWIVVLKEPKQPNRRLTVRKKEFWIGSNPMCDVVVRDQFVSNKHLNVSVTRGGSYLRDNQSKNGSFVSEERFSDIFLTFGKKFTIGQTRIMIIR